MRKKGFTLLELLMAAAIISALASVAVASYRAKMADTYVEDGKNQVRALTTAVRLFELEYSVSVRQNSVDDAPFDMDGVTCAPTAVSTANQVVACNFLENRRWGNELITLSIEETRVCANGKSSPKLPSKYRNKKIFCIAKATGESVPTN